MTSATRPGRRWPRPGRKALRREETSSRSWRWRSRGRPGLAWTRHRPAGGDVQTGCGKILVEELVLDVVLCFSHLLASVLDVAPGLLALTLDLLNFSLGLFGGVVRGFAVLLLGTNCRDSDDSIHSAAERSPSPVYGAGLLNRLGCEPLGGSNPPLSAKSRHPRSRSSGNSEVGHDSEMVARPDAIDRFVEDPRAGADLERRSPMLAASHEDVVEPAERPVPSADGPGSDTWSTLPLRGNGKRLGGAPAILVLEGSLVSSPEAPVAQPG